MKVLTNSFSLNMLANPDETYGINVPIIKEEIPSDITSAIGHADTASVVSTELGFNVPANRVTLQLTPEDEVYVAQYIGPRLEEGATTLPEGATIKYYRIYIKKLTASYRCCIACDIFGSSPCIPNCDRVMEEVQRDEEY